MKHINVKHLAGVTAAALLMSSTALADTADSALVKEIGRASCRERV